VKAVRLAVSISLGSLSRDYRVLVSPPGGPRVELRRIGTGGDIERAAALVRDYDGRADAIGLGGVNLAFCIGRRRWAFPAGQYLLSQARRTPVVDGAGFKEAIEPDIVRKLAQSRGVSFAGTTALVTSVLDRYPLAHALSQAGAFVLAGDPLFALRVPLALPLGAFAAAATLTMPALRHLPLRFLYPRGDELRAAEQAGQPGMGRAQPRRERRAPWWLAAWVRRAQVVAGDFHLLARFGRLDLGGKVVITSALDDADVAWLFGCGAALVATATPRLERCSPAANAMEALLVACIGLPPAAGDRPAGLRRAWRELGLQPYVERRPRGGAGVG
jgi:hypothetical protein